MKININYLFALLIFLTTPLISFSQVNPQDFFNNASKVYYSGNTTNAKKIVLEGLGRFPDNAKLKALKEKIDEEEEKEQSKNKENQKDDKSDNQKKEDEKKQQDQKQDQQNKQEQQKKQNQPQEAKISPEQAQRLLDAMKKNEKEQLLKRNDFQKRNERRKAEKDW